MTEPTLEYREIAPPAVAAPFVRCIWRLRGESDGTVEPIIPDGCAEVVVNVADPFVRHTSPGASHTQPRRLVAGQITRALSVQPSGRIDIWGIRFHPWCAASFLGVSAAELRDQVVELDAAAPSLERSLARVGDVQSESGAERMIMNALSRRATNVQPPAANVPRLVMFAAAGSETWSVNRLARDAGVGTRRMQSIFREHVGLTPKQLLRVTRFQRALFLARTHSEMSWGRIAHVAGYYDQAHLIHDSNEIAGCTPSALVSRDAQLTEVFLASE